jgi:oligopeptide/dipeptide ABC transporter ATP-binding protein
LRERGNNRALARKIQLVFQDPFSSLDPRLSVEKALKEVLRVHGLHRGAEAARVAELLSMVGLTGRFATRFPHELSGGQAQRVAIARALAVEPEVLVLDEPTSALDVSVRAEIVNLLVRIQDELNLSYVFVSHDLSMVRHLSEEIAVMYLGRVVETGESELLYEHPRHPYTAALLSAVPRPAANGLQVRQRIILAGDVPSPVHPPSACVFHPRCPRAKPGVCDVILPDFSKFEGDHVAACHFPVERWPIGEDELRKTYPAEVAV